MPKITELNAITTVANNDLLMVVHDPSGLPSTNKVTLSNFATSITAALKTANSTIAGTIKVGDGLAVSNTGVLSANALSILPSSNTYEGYILTWDDQVNSSIWSAFSGVVDYTLINSANSYSALKHDNVLFVDPNAISQNIKIILPDASSTPAAIAGKSYFIKNINNGGQYKVKVTTYSGETSNSNYLENPVTGSFVVSYDLVDKGSGDQWIFDGSVWRHISTQRAVPIFYTSVDTYAQVAIKNASLSNTASSDLVLYNNQGDEAAGTGPFIDIGINSNTYANATYSIGGPSDAYVFNSGGDLTIGTETPGTSLILHAGSTTNVSSKAVVNSTAIFANTDFVPTQNNTFSLGSANKQWKDLWVSNNTIYIGGVPVTVSGGLLAVNGSISTGYTGSSGTNGYTGSEGTGYAGSAGTNGYTGSVGSAGSIGYTGSEGSLGYTGSEGSAGSLGYTGSAGSIGYTGSEGAAGTIGYTGSEGAAGSTGYVGSEGAAGTNGYTGSEGGVGYTGSAGDPLSSGNFLFTSNNSIELNSASPIYFVDNWNSGVEIITSNYNQLVWASSVDSISYSGNTVYLYLDNSGINFSTYNGTNAYDWNMTMDGNLSFPNGTKIKNNATLVSNSDSSYASGGANAIVWTASSNSVVAAKVTVRVQSDMNSRTELFTMIISKDSSYVNSSIVEQVTSNGGYGASVISAGLDANNCLVIAHKDPNGFGNGYTVKSEEFNNNW